MTTLVPLALTLLAALAVAARPAPNDSMEVHRNSATRANVEQQSPDACYFDVDLSDCVTNTGTAVWDPDDLLIGVERDGDGVIRARQFADWAGHVWGVGGCWPKRYEPQMTVRFEPQGYTHTFDFGRRWQEGRFVCYRDCILGPWYDADAALPEVSHQGGDGGILGHAVETTLTFQLTGVPEKYRSYAIAAGLNSEQTRGHWCSMPEWGDCTPALLDATWCW